MLFCLVIVNRISGFGLWVKELLMGMCHYFLTLKRQNYHSQNEENNWQTD